MPADMQTVLRGISEPARVCLVLCGLARSSPIEVQVAMANAIRNRVAAGYGETYSDVVTAPHEYGCLSPEAGARNYERVLQIGRAFAAGVPMMQAHPKVRQCWLVTRGILDDYLLDTVQGATHCHVTGINPRPAWARLQKSVCRRGVYMFYVVPAEAARVEPSPDQHVSG